MFVNIKKLQAFSVLLLQMVLFKIFSFISFMILYVLSEFMSPRSVTVYMHVLHFNNFKLYIIISYYIILFLMDK